MKIVKSLVFYLILAFSLAWFGADRASAGEVTRYSVSNGKTVYIGGIANILVQVENPIGSLLLLAGGSQRLNVAPDGTFTEQARSTFIRNRNALLRADSTSCLSTGKQVSLMPWNIWAT